MQGSSSVSSAGCSCIAALALRSPDNAQVLVDNGAADTIVDALKIHDKNGKLQVDASICARLVPVARAKFNAFPYLHCREWPA